MSGTDVTIDGERIWTIKGKLSDKDIKEILKNRKARKAYEKFKKNKSSIKDKVVKDLFGKISDKIPTTGGLPKMTKPKIKDKKGKKFWERSSSMKKEDITSNVISDILRLKDQILSSQNKNCINDTSIDVVSGVTHGAIDSMTVAELFTLRSFLKDSDRAIRENSYDDIQSAIKSLSIILDTTLQSDSIDESEWVKINRIKDQLEQLDLEVRKITAKADKSGEEPDLASQFNEVIDLIKEVAESLGVKVPNISKIHDSKEKSSEKPEDKEGDSTGSEE